MVPQSKEIFAFFICISANKLKHAVDFQATLGRFLQNKQVVPSQIRSGILNQNLSDPLLTAMQFSSLDN